MTKIASKPWENINISSAKRIDTKQPHNFYWVKDDKGRPGIRIKFKNIPEDATPIIKIVGITAVIRRNEADDDELFLILTRASDEDLFYTLCIDLIKSSSNINTESKLYNTIADRLKHWQRFLSTGAIQTMSEQIQMGLFTELIFLINNVLSNLKTNTAIVTWVGPDFDKQDFSLDSYSVEIKSFITSKGPFIRISSIYQLINNIKPLYLFAVGITRSDNGRSIINLINDVKTTLIEDIRSFVLFEEKLEQYGYYEGITEGPFYKYNVDNQRVYVVDKSFPKITPAILADQITAAQYTIDLSRCDNFETELPPITDI